MLSPSFGSCGARRIVKHGQAPEYEAVPLLHLPSPDRSERRWNDYDRRRQGLYQVLGRNGPHRDPKPAELQSFGGRNVAGSSPLHRGRLTADLRSLSARARSYSTIQHHLWRQRHPSNPLAICLQAALPSRPHRLSPSPTHRLPS